MSTVEQLHQASTRAAVADRPKTILDYLNDKRVADGFSAVATRYLNPQRMLRLCVNAVRKTPKLAACDPQTVLGSMMTSTALGLEPNTITGEAYLIPYARWVKNRAGKFEKILECQFQIGYKGFRTLAYRSPLVKRVSFNAVHERDRFEYLEGSEVFLRFAVNITGERGAPVAAYSHVLFANGLETACVLPLDEIEKIRGRSETWRNLRAAIGEAKSDKDRDKAQTKFNETPWELWFDDMAAKSAFKKHAKQLPIDSQDALLAAADLDSHADEGRANMRAFVDPDVVREVFNDGGEIPQLSNDASPDAEFVGAMNAAEAEAAGGAGREEGAAPAAQAAQVEGEKKAQPEQKAEGGKK